MGGGFGHPRRGRPGQFARFEDRRGHSQGDGQGLEGPVHDRECDNSDGQIN
jgi:hypothetical protein